MVTETKNVAQETGRWLRVGVLTLTTFGPIINTVVARLREKDANMKSDKQPQIVAKPSLSESLLELKEHPYSQDIIKRGEVLASELEDLLERGNKLSQVLVERSGEVTRDLAERSSKVSHDLVRRGEKVTKELSRQSYKLNRELSKRGAKMTRDLSRKGRDTRKDLAEQDSAFWITLGFSVGLSAAGLAAFFFLRRRFLHKLEEEEQHFELNHNGQISGSAVDTSYRGELRPLELSSTGTAAQPVATRVAPAVAIAEENAGKQIKPGDSQYVGINSTKHYYPIDTPIEQITTAGEGGKDLIYFASEEEAQAQGFTAPE